MGHPDASTFPKATFELLELKHLPADSFGCCGFKICEVGPLGGDGDKVRRQIRVSEISGTAADRPSPLLWYSCCSGFLKVHLEAVCMIKFSGSPCNMQGLVLQLMSFCFMRQDAIRLANVGGSSKGLIWLRG